MSIIDVLVSRSGRAGDDTCFTFRSELDANALFPSLHRDLDAEMPKPCPSAIDLRLCSSAPLRGLGHRVALFLRSDFSN